MSQTLLSVIVPAYNEEEAIEEFHRRLAPVLAALDCDAEIVFVNDGSSDATLDILHRLSEEDSRVTVLNLSRNFGKERAMSAGLDYAHGDAVAVIDADLQDPPEVIPELVAGWREGYDVVYAQRTRRHGESWFKRATAGAFYRVIQQLSRVHIPHDTGDFRLLSRRAVDALKQLREQHRFMKGLFSWVGFPQKPVRYERDPRHAGQTKWNYWKLWNFALDGLTAFSNVPLKIASYLGGLVAMLALTYGGWVIIKTLLFGEPVQGYPSMMVAILFLGGVQLIFIGVMGEYLGRMFDETKNRPLYFVQEYRPAQTVRPRLQHGATGKHRTSDGS
ncbi:glycosyltransferase family 2 protein [Thioalkalivibrio paradoxus]|uniref:Glycosyl transferase family 2 n=1 Tax=Thioalkalivibrio paradoxus ARh 1 TaxID=713585 RepID=W0DGQ7_9GAMM|nr:glycosyltransferase family 2 protein [Thioalkalivibrio paradoxus]AHE97809.1 glycosyl transferase family 2 [Thioalkalivibrio paradoxus ARh 1]